MILTHGANSIGGEKIPEILFASDDFINIHAGTVLSTNVTQADVHRLTISGASRPYDDGILINSPTQWNQRNYVNHTNKTTRVQVPFDKLTEFSIQYYTALFNDMVLYVSVLPGMIALYNGYNLLLDIPTGATAYNNAGLYDDVNSWSNSKLVCRTGGQPKWMFYAIVGSKLSNGKWDINLYGADATERLSPAKRLYNFSNVSISNNYIQINDNNAALSISCFMALQVI